ncbi:MAG TPA: hypothetical protein VF432_31615 [Thermoanaerobaculia bacterium]
MPEDPLQEMLHRRTLPVLTTQFPDSLPAWAAGLKAERVIGPVRDELGRDTFIDVFRRVRQVQFVHNAGEAPFLAVPLSQLNIAIVASSTTMNLASGSFWIATKLLAAAAGDGVYTGLRIARGRVQFDQPVSFSGDQVLVPAGTGIRVDLELAPPPPPGGTGPGRDVRESLFQPPRNVTFTIAAASATVAVAEPCALRIYDQDVSLRPPAGTATYLAPFNRVKIPLTPEPATFTAGTVHSASLRPEGSAAIAAGGWALPAARIAPADLGEASGVGALMLELGDGLSATWTGQNESVPLGPTLLFIDEARLATASAFAHAYGLAQHPELPEAAGRGRLALAWERIFPLTYFAQANGSEAVFSAARFRASLEKPVDVNGDRVSVDAPAGVVFIENADGRFLWVAGEVQPPSTSRGLAFSLTNAVLRASLPVQFNLLARYDGVTAPEGVLALGYILAAIIPSLPDPYATNAMASRDRGRFGRLTSLSSWTATSATLDFQIPTMPDLPLRVLDASPDEAVGMIRSGSAPPPEPRGLLNILRFFGSRAFRPEEELGPARRAMGDALRFEGLPRLILLDLSTNASQFGVALRPPPTERVEVHNVPVKPPAIQDLSLAVDGRALTLLTLPAVQWEPASGEPVDETPLFPRAVRFAKNGVPSLVDVPTVNLVPVTPHAALDTIVGNFAQERPRPARARFTLPFGMIANAILQKPGPHRGALVREPRPSSADGLQAIRQLRIDAADPSLGAGKTPALPGFTVQLPNATPADGSPGPRSILGTSVTDIFNGYLGSGKPTALVPVTRIDLSGYGESLFSGWQNPTDHETQVAKAEFKVLNGRAAHEVVQVRSILLPYYVRVVRTITLERKNNAAITRHDSGWVAVDDGEYRFPPASGIVTHPGIVRRITNVSHIRETGDRVTKNGIEFAGVYYQGDVVLDGAAKPVPVKQHFGYIKIGTAPLTPGPYAALLAEAGPLCGPIDTTIHVGNGPQAMRLHRIGVGVTPAGGGPQFVMTAWGALVFPGGGEWSVLQSIDTTGAPQPVPRDEGLPLIRREDGPDRPYRFADPSDLARESAPSRDYGLLHSMGTQRAFFRRPIIRETDLTRIVSKERPVIADPYVMATALGPFPKQSQAIPFPPTPWALAVDGGGNYRLEMPASFPAGIGRRTMRQAGSVKSDLDYTASVVTYQIDTSQPVPWRFSLTKATKIMNNAAMGDMIRLTVDVNAEAGRETTFDEPQLELGGALEIVQDLLTILASLGVTGVLTTVMTNEWSLLATLQVPFVDKQFKDLQVPPRPDPHPVVKFSDTGLKVENTAAPHADSALFELGGSPHFAIKSIPGLYVVAIIQFQFEVSTEDGTTYKLLLGVGLAYELEAGPFELEGLIALTFFAVWGDTICGYGVGFLLKLSASIEPIVSVEISLEGRLARVVVHKGLPDETVFCAAKLTFAIEVSVFLILSISFEVETECVETVRGPLPESALPAIV